MTTMTSEEFKEVFRFLFPTQLECEKELKFAKSKGWVVDPPKPKTKLDEVREDIRRSLEYMSTSVSEDWNDGWNLGARSTQKLYESAILELQQTHESEVKRLEDGLSVAVEYLEKLSRLGNGEILGNSTGNKMAQEAIKRIKELEEQCKKT